MSLRWGESLYYLGGSSVITGSLKLEEGSRRGESEGDLTTEELVDFGEISETGNVAGFEEGAIELKHIILLTNVTLI